MQNPIPEKKGKKAKFALMVHFLYSHGRRSAFPFTIKTSLSSSSCLSLRSRIFHFLHRPSFSFSSLFSLSLYLSIKHFCQYLSECYVWSSRVNASPLPLPFSEIKTLTNFFLFLSLSLSLSLLFFKSLHLYVNTYLSLSPFL